MLYKWEQLRYERGELSRWRLVNKETGQVVLELRLSNHGNKLKLFGIATMLFSLVSCGEIVAKPENKDDPNFSRKKKRFSKASYIPYLPVDSVDVAVAEAIWEPNSSNKFIRSIKRALRY